MRAVQKAFRNQQCMPSGRPAFSACTSSASVYSRIFKWDTAFFAVSVFVFSALLLLCILEGIPLIVTEILLLLIFMGYQIQPDIDCKS